MFGELAATVGRNSKVKVILNVRTSMLLKREE